MPTPQPEPAAPASLTDDTGRPALPILSVRWAHQVPAKLTPGPGCLVAVELRTPLHIAHGYAHVWHPRTAGVARSLGLAAAPEVVGTTTSTWDATRRGIGVQTLRFLGDRGLSGVVLSALDVAMWDLRCRERGRSIETIIGRSGDAATYSGIGLEAWCDAAELERGAAALVGQGFHAFKLWVTSTDMAAERARIQAVRAVIGRDRRLFVDGAAAYDVESARPMLELAAEHGVEWVEDPIDRADVAGMATLAERSPVPLAGGQNASVADLTALLEGAPLHTALVDLQQVGGITGWLAAAAVCAAHGARLTSHASTHMGARLLAGAGPEGTIVQHAPWDDDVFGPMPLHDGRVRPYEGVGAVPPITGALDWVEA